MRLTELFFSFFRGFFYWIGAGLALIVFIASIAALGQPGCEVKIKSLPVAGFENVPWKGGPAIGLIRIDAEIGSPQINCEKIRHLLEACQSTPLKGKIKGILLEINSPGGSSLDSEGIYELLRSYKTLYHTPIYAFVNGYCASGGYYIACASDKIMATQASIIGSVGVLSRRVNYSRAMQTLGLQGVIFKRGIGKDAFDPMKPLDESERAFIDPVIDDIYERFTQVVASARPQLDQDTVKKIGARIYPAQEAKNLGYIDEAGFDRSMAVALLANHVGLDKSFALLELKPAATWPEVFVETSSQAFQSIVHTSLGSWQICLH